jgi:hypothetical protein
MLPRATAYRDPAQGGGTNRQAKDRAPTSLQRYQRGHATGRLREAFRTVQMAAGERFRQSHLRSYAKRPGSAREGGKAMERDGRSSWGWTGVATEGTPARKNAGVGASLG